MRTPRIHFYRYLKSRQLCQYLTVRSQLLQCQFEDTHSLHPVSSRTKRKRDHQDSDSDSEVPPALLLPEKRGCRREKKILSADVPALLSKPCCSFKCTDGLSVNDIRTTRAHYASLNEVQRHRFLEEALHHGCETRFVGQRSTFRANLCIPGLLPSIYLCSTALSCATGGGICRIEQLMKQCRRGGSGVI